MIRNPIYTTRRDSPDPSGSAARPAWQLKRICRLAVRVASEALLAHSCPRQLVTRSGGNGDRRASATSDVCLQWLELTLSGDSGQLAAGSLPKTAVSSPLRRECRLEPESPVPQALGGIFRMVVRWSPRADGGSGGEMPHLLASAATTGLRARRAYRFDRICPCSGSLGSAAQRAQAGCVQRCWRIVRNSAVFSAQVRARQLVGGRPGVAEPHRETIRARNADN